MENIIISGSKALNGSVELQGSKNSALPILAAAAAVDGVCVIHNCPNLTDVAAALKILDFIGCKTKREGHTVIVDSTGADKAEIPESMMKEMRSSILFLGAMLARFGCGSMTAPGGCEIGLRPIDLHLSSFRRMGAVISDNGGRIECGTPFGLSGVSVSLAFPSVGATENIILASLGAEGETVITNAAREPEITDLARFLSSCGAQISGAGESVIRIKGGAKLRGCEHKIIPDRIVASTYIACAASAGGKISVKGANCSHLSPVIPAFEAAGCEIGQFRNELTVRAPERLSRIKYLRTMPYPGFPTDSQAIVTAMLARSEGTSVIIEKIFENRFRHVPELIKMGADIRVEDGCVAVIEGVERLSGARVGAFDLRGGCALAVAALGAEGETVIENIHHIDRGCESLEARLCELGAKAKRVKIN